MIIHLYSGLTRLFFADFNCHQPATTSSILDDLFMASIATAKGVEIILVVEPLLRGGSTTQPAWRRL